MHATELWSLWQALLAPFADAFTYPGFQRFTEWVTGLVLNVEEHTITQSLLGLNRPGDWKALESFAEYGAWDQDAVERAAARLLDAAPDRLWHGYVVDFIQVHYERSYFPAFNIADSAITVGAILGAGGSLALVFTQLACVAAAGAVIALFAVETKGRTLEELNS